MSKIFSAAVVGLDSKLIEVEADVGGGQSGVFAIVGLPDTSVNESRDRVWSAVKNSQVDFPRQKIVVNLAPADIRKEGPAYDLPITLSVLQAAGKIFLRDQDREAVYVGELSLDGHLRNVNGALSIAIMAKQKGIGRVFVPKGNAPEAALVDGVEIVPVGNLTELIEHLRGENQIEVYKREERPVEEELLKEIDMAYIKGQEHVKRALEIAAAGQHNVLMSGPPGSGKTMLARTVPTILPQMTREESLEVTRIYSVAGMLPHDQPMMTVRPFRTPHHTASGVALVGGGAWPRPGEISLAHRGVLFLDEFPEFPRMVLDNLRQPLEDGVVNISRAAGTLQFPAKFILLASMNPCPCGFYSDPEKKCICSAMQVTKYQKRISGPMLDRIDLHIEVPRVPFDKLSSIEEAGESSQEIRNRVNRARNVQAERFKGTKVITNAEMSSHQVKEMCQVEPKTQELLRSAVQQLHLSARGYYRILKLSRTIADLAQSDSIKIEHVAEALQYRPKIE